MQTPSDPDHLAPPDYKPETFGRWLRRCRETTGVTRRVFADSANVSECDVRNFETVRRLPTAEQRMRLIQAVAKLDRNLAATVPMEPA